MRGHIRKRGEKSWAVVVDLGRDPETGKRRQKWVTVRGTKRDAEKVLAELLAKAGRGELGTAPRSLTVAALLDMWLEVSRRRWKPGTAVAAETAVKTWKELLGHVPAGKLGPADVEKALARMEGELSPATCRYRFGLLRQAMRWAVKRKLLGQDPTEGVAPPRAPRKEVRVWSEEEIARFLGVLDSSGHRPAVKAFFRLALSTGMRKGELLALRWEDVDFEKGCLYVRRTRCHHTGGVHEPKSPSSCRKVALDAGSLECLRRLKREQAREKLRAGAEWCEQGLVFATRKGKALSVFRLACTFRSLCRRAGVPEIRIHDLRHTHASLLLRQGVHPKVVQERLGHSSVKITLDTYSHLLPDAQEQAVKALERALGGEEGRR
ncbi:integrase family protein [Ammonifex degensii KC4]|uniref:Integrase family protein n=1 Tax=Ammonifex degensii (strain DSM 10501 / KC4) TaxID=429009 RepID=C9RCJ5_AMMDK|nr:site-specific integrase [Ammonifex degensii]ACX51972.1 integrase family protein [Ammonifex degensii KC4]